MSNPGRGRGESSKLAKIELDKIPMQRYPGTQPPGGGRPVLDIERSSTGSSGSNSDQDNKPIRGRGGFRKMELRTIPEGIKEVRSKRNASGLACNLLTNFVKITPMPDRCVYQYRVDMEPNVEAISLRGRLFHQATKDLFPVRCVYDNMSDARCSHKTDKKETKLTVEHPNDGKIITITIKLVGQVTPDSFEMIRLYNMHMKTFLRALGFFQAGQAGAYVHEDLASPVGTHELMMVRGYRTGANIHEEGTILMNLESVHKLVQRKNVLELIMSIRNSCQGNLAETVKNELVGKLVITRYHKMVYLIEDVNFNINPGSTFPNQEGGETSYLDYYKRKYSLNIRDSKQPLLLCVPNNARAREDGDKRELFLVPELCNIAGLTNSQRADNRLKVDLIRSSQVPPPDRVKNLKTFLQNMHNNSTVQSMLTQWSYTYEREPLKIKGRILPKEGIGNGLNIMKDPKTWPQVDFMASFDNLVLNGALAVKPKFPKMYIIISRPDIPHEQAIVGKLRNGFKKIGLVIDAVDFTRIQNGDSAQQFVAAIKNLPGDTTAALVILPRQNKERYDSIKKSASCEKGLITQVVTSRLMQDDRKAGGAAVKIGIQMAAKVGGEPWYINLPLTGCMVCGYDTYHDTANRGRSFGAFLASMNNRYSRWFSKADCHTKLDELTSHISNNIGESMKAYQEKNGQFPERVYVYRDGVGEGQLEHVFNVETKQIKETIKGLSPTTTLAFVIVNKRIGARFYMSNEKEFVNPPPGTVIDDVVTRRERFDFYLVSQSTRHGTITPTYYNIIFDDTGIPPERHQMIAFKMCFNYYNWSGTVRVPAPCQYAHKLALLCGEHLHQVPNSALNNRLHFL